VTRNPLMQPTNSIAFYALLALAGLPVRTLAQQSDYRARANQLGLESLPGRIPSYYSSGARERAAALQKMLSEATAYFQERLGMAPDLALAVLNEADWTRLRPLPYGVPWVSSSPYLAVLPGDLEHSVIVQGFSAARANVSAKTRRALEDAGLPLARAPYLLNDLIGYHEVGHVVIDAHGLSQTQLWFNELLATFAAYAFMRERHPDVARQWDALMRFNVEAYRPEFRSLQTFEKRYGNMPQDTYAWFQGMFHLRLADVYEKRDLEFLRDLQGAGIVAGAKYATAAELIARLEEASPGFRRWGRLLEGHQAR
jgi:hypothetical protein